MGASDSKLVFKKGIFRLSEERRIPADDPYWTSFWELPESPEDVFSLFSPADIRRTRDAALENLETLLSAVTAHLFALRHHPAFPDAAEAPEREALNCIRVLTRVLPYIYERDALRDWEQQFLWSARRERTRTTPSNVLFEATTEGDGDSPKESPSSSPLPEAKPLAEELIDTLTDLLFYGGFTVARQPPGKPRVSYTIWQSGVGCNTTAPTSREMENNRCEILRLLLTLASPGMYQHPGALPAQGVRALTYMCTCPDKQVVLSVLCSLLNTTVKYNPASWRVPYNSLVFKDPRQSLVTYSLHFLLVVLLYPVPPDPITGAVPKNYYRHFLGRLHRPADFQFIVDGMTRILNQPLQATASYLPGTQSSVKFAPEIIMLFWEVTQCNKRFRSFIVDTRRAHDFIVLVLFYALECKHDGARQGVVRMCAFVLQTLSVEKSFGVHLNEPFTAQDTLPPAIRIPNFSGTYADFLIQSIYALITTSQSRLAAIYPALLAVLNNIAAYVEGLSARTCSRLVQLFSSMSSPSFLLANDSNHDLLRSLLEALNAIVEHQRHTNPQLVLAILRSRRRFEALRNLTLDSGREEIARRSARRKDANAHASRGSGGGGGDDLSFDLGSRRGSLDSLRNPTSPRSSQHTLRSSSTLSNVAEAEADDTFAIGDDDDDEADDDEEDGDSDDDENARPTPSQSSLSENPSRASSVVSVEEALPTQLRGMSEKARGKMPAGAGPFTFSRQNSTTSLGSGSVGGGGMGGGGGSGSTDNLHGMASASAASGTSSVGIGGGGSGGGYFEPTTQWVESWLPELPLHTMLTLIQQLSALVPREALTTATTTTADGAAAAQTPDDDVLATLRDVRLVGIEPSAIRVHSFEWSPLALGWYESLLWGFIFSSEMQVAKGTVVGVWNGTAIKLFRVQETAAQGPSLTSPRGAVDAVGSNIVSRIGQMHLRGPGSVGGGAGGVGGGASGDASHPGQA